MDARILSLIACRGADRGALAPAAAAQQVAPDVRNLEIAPKSFKALERGRPRRRSRAAALVEFDLRDGAQVTFTFRSVKSGRREGGKCKPGKAKSAKKRCEIVTTVPGHDALRRDSPATTSSASRGASTTATLKPGTYRLVAKAAGTAARSSFTTFKIIK